MTKPSLLLIPLTMLFVQLPWASAQASEWAVVPATGEKMPTFMEGVVTEINRELERRGEQVWPSVSAVAHFERQDSTEPVALSEDALEKWLEDSRAGLHRLALGDHEAALQHLGAADQITRQALVTLNREPQHAQQVLDTCLYMVRAMFEVNRAADANKLAKECAFFVPRGVPRKLMHPPHVLTLYDEVRAVGSAATGSLMVESDRRGCDVRINGVYLGRTPLETRELIAGSYAVQVECAAPRRGRIHLTRVGPGTTRVAVNGAFDRAVRTQPILRLEYGKSGSSVARTADARRIAETLPASRVLLVSLPRADVIELDLIAASGSRMGCARIDVTPKGPKSDDLAVAVRNVVEGKCRDPSTSSSIGASERASPPLFKPEI